MRGGAAAFLRKPVDGHVLVETILAAVARSCGSAEDTWSPAPDPDASRRPS
jgi:FixJ family two-component response regulator